jgi:hypothetical protein
VKPTRVRLLVALAVLATAVGLALLRTLRAGGTSMAPVPWTAAGALLLVAALVYAAAVPVRRWTRRTGPGVGRAMDPLRAARTAVLGKATAIGGAVVVGWYLAQVLLVAPDLDIASRRTAALRAGITALAALIASAAGLLAERMCRVPPAPGAGDGGVGGVGGRTASAGHGGDEADVTRESQRHE